MISLKDNDKFRWGIVGTGHIARKFANDIQHLGNHTIAAVCSRDASRARDFASLYGQAQSVDGHLSLIAYRDTFDAVYVATNTHLHYPTSLFYLSHSVPVLCEKPFVLSANQGFSIVDMAKKTNTSFMEALWTLYLPFVQQFLNFIRSGNIGTVLEIDSAIGRPLSKTDIPRVWRKDLGGGALFDSGIYAVALIVELVGKPDTVQAASKLNDDGTDDTTSAIFNYANCAARMETSITTQLHNSMIVRGTEATVVLDGPLYNPTRYTVFKNQRLVHTEERGEYFGAGLREQARHFEFMTTTGLIESTVNNHERTLLLSTLLSDIANMGGVRYA